MEIDEFHSYETKNDQESQEKLEINGIEKENV